MNGRRAFDTDSDTEVLLNAYLACGYRFYQQGQKNLCTAIMDTGKNQLLLYRDRSGIAAFLYGLRGDGNRSLCFGTEGAPGLPGYPPRN